MEDPTNVQDELHVITGLADLEGTPCLAADNRWPPPQMTPLLIRSGRTCL